MPTPDVRWAILSFPDDEPPIVIGFTRRAASLQIGGAPGRWTIGTAGKDDLGWVRLALPVGNHPFATNSPGELGRLAALAGANAALWSVPPADLKGFSVVGDANGVTATWSFDRPGVVVPLALDLASGGGYGVRILSGVRRTGLKSGETGDRDEITTVVTTGPDLVVRFPARLVPPGRALAIGRPEPLAPPTGATDVGGVARYALSRLLAGSAPAPDALDDAYYAAAPSGTEPLTGQRLLFAPDGTGLDLAAANALLARCRANAAADLAAASLLPPPAPPSAPASAPAAPRPAAGAEGESAGVKTEAAGRTPLAEPQLVSLVWRRDWRTLGFFGVESRLARRAGALAALAGALSPDPARRLEGALFEAGLAADRVLAVRRALAAGAPSPRLGEPFGPLRAALFARAFGREDDPFWATLRSPLRVGGEGAVTTEDGETLAWTAPFRLAAEPGTTLGGVAYASAPVPAPPNRAPLLRPKAAPPLPGLAPVPGWSEAPR